MNKIAINLIILGLFLASCENKTETGALVGAGAGAVAGGLIGGGAGGVLIGGAVGAAGGALIGYALDENDRRKMEEQNPNTLKRIDRGEQLSINDVKEMTQAGLKDNVIIDQIKATSSVFYLSTADIVDLKKSGVSQKVIDAMIRSAR